MKKGALREPKERQHAWGAKRAVKVAVDQDAWHAAGMLWRDLQDYIGDVDVSICDVCVEALHVNRPTVVLQGHLRTTSILPAD
jgi:hypothetical protein